MDDHAHPATNETQPGPPAGPPRVAGFSWARTFAALQHRNYRLFFIGQLVSLTGTWMQNVAERWLVWELTSSPFKLGVVTFAAGVPYCCSRCGADSLRIACPSAACCSSPSRS